MEETRKCPHCAMENPKNRITCQVCHERMDWKNVGERGSTPKDTKAEKAKEKEKGNPENPTPTGSTIPDNKTKVTSPPVNPPPATKKIIKRRKRHTPPESTEPTFFMLEDGKLTAVKVSMVIKPIKASELSDSEEAMVRFINRNRNILTG